MPGPACCRRADSWTTSRSIGTCSCGTAICSVVVALCTMETRHQPTTATMIAGSMKSDRQGTSMKLHASSLPGPTRRFVLGLLALLTGLALGAASPLALAVEAPDKQIEKLSAEVLARIKADPEIRAGNLDRISQAVDEMLMPSVDFQRMTALSVGRGWREATPEQR